MMLLFRFRFGVPFFCSALACAGASGCDDPDPMTAAKHTAGGSRPASGSDDLDAVDAAKAAEQSFHAACDEFSALQTKGKGTSAAAAKIQNAYHDFMMYILKTKFTPNAAVVVPEELAGAGKLRLPDGSTWSYLVGKGQSGLIFSLWKREAWGPRLPPHGIEASVGIEPTELKSKFNVGPSAWEDPRRHDVLRVPYTLEKVSGTIEIRRIGNEWRVHPDRGVVGPGNWWRPFGNE